MIKEVVANEDIGFWLNKFSMDGYQYIVRCTDKFLSGWGGANGKKHIQLIASTDLVDARAIIRDLSSDKTISHIKLYPISDKRGIIATTRNKSYSIRNDWKCHKGGE